VCEASARRHSPALVHPDEHATPLTGRDEQGIFPDPTTAPMVESWRSGAVEAMKRQNAALVGVASDAHQVGAVRPGSLHPGVTRERAIPQRKD
jgi:hypothetical protein